MRVFEETSKKQDENLTHPSDKKYTKALEQRDKKAQQQGRFVNPLFFQERIVRISSYTIRAVQRNNHWNVICQPYGCSYG